MRGQASETERRATTPGTPPASSSSISATSACGETTTPLPMKQSTLGRMIPDGMRCRTVFLPPTTSVWPALCPPWKRTTPCARSVSQSTILPLPSSPHWVPMTTTLRALMGLFDHASDAPEINGEASGRPRAAEGLAHLVVAPAARDGAADARAIGIEDDARVVVIAAQLGEIEAHGHRAGLGERTERLQRLRQRRQLRQALLRRAEHLGAAVELRQELERRARFRVELAREAAELGQVLLLQRLEKPHLEPGMRPGGVGEGAKHRHVADVEPQPAQLREAQRVAKQALDLEVRLDAGGAVDLGAELDRLARRARRRRARMEDAPAIAKPGDALAVEKVRVDARHLRGDVGTHAHHAARELVDHLEGAKLEVVSGAREERIHVLEERRHDELVAALEEEVEHAPAQALHAHRLRRQDVLHILRQEPAHRG